MLHLLIVSLLWALSFGLTAQVADLGAPFVTAVRTLLAAGVFLPFLDLKGLRATRAWGFVGIGALQFGLMYLLYVTSFHWLRPSEVALATIFTPLFVTLAEDLMKRRMAWRILPTALLAVAGTGVCLGPALGRHGVLWGFLFMQGANGCFALGQVLYRRWAPGAGKQDRQLMGLLYLGASGVALAMVAPTLATSGFPTLTLRQVGVLVYLGAVASGLGFFLFNVGARRTDIGTLAIFNNMKIPLAILAAGLVFHEPVAWLRLGLGGLVITAAFAWNTFLGARP